jgi:rRNA maturation endonuclease Nob1
MYNGQPVHKFSQISDPQGLARIIKSVKKELFDQLKKVSASELICSSCKTTNLKKSKFCNSCGKPLVAICPKCKKSNPSDADFCNQCGSQLD